MFSYLSLPAHVLLQKKEKSESEKLLTEQLQAKELELLQLKTEMETSQGTGGKHMDALIWFLTAAHHSKK